MRSLKYDEKPDYGKIRKSINEAVSSLKVIYGGIVSWIMSNALIIRFLRNLKLII